MDIKCTCGCCGALTSIDTETFNNEVDLSDGTIPMCESCIEKSMLALPTSEDTDPEIIRKFKHIAKNGYATVIHENKRYVVDSFSASAVKAVWDVLSEKNRADWLEKTKGHPVMMADIAFKLINRQKKG